MLYSDQSPVPVEQADQTQNAADSIEPTVMGITVLQQAWDARPENDQGIHVVSTLPANWRQLFSSDSNTRARRPTTAHLRWYIVTIKQQRLGTAVCPQ